METKQNKMTPHTKKNPQKTKKSSTKPLTFAVCHPFRSSFLGSLDQQQIPTMLPEQGEYLSEEMSWLCTDSCPDQAFAGCCCCSQAHGLTLGHIVWLSLRCSWFCDQPHLCSLHTLGVQSSISYITHPACDHAKSQSQGGDSEQAT